jgi:hypothetical protein
MTGISSVKYEICKFSLATAQRKCMNQSQNSALSYGLDVGISFK